MIPDRGKGGKWKELFCEGLPKTEAPHLGVSSGGVEVEGVFAKFAGRHLGIDQLGMANSNSMFPEPFNAGQLHGDMPAISTEYEHAFPQLQFQHKYQPTTKTAPSTSPPPELTSG